MTWSDLPAITCAILGLGSTLVFLTTSLLVVLHGMAKEHGVTDEEFDEALRRSVTPPGGEP